MRWLIDGYNVIRRDPELAGIERRGLEDGRAALLRCVAAVARESRDEFIVVFDGARLTGTAPGTGRVRAVFSKPPERADDVLGRLARQLGGGATVVTSDRAVQDAARRARAAVVSAEAFLQRVSPESPPEDEPEEPGRPISGPKKGNPRRLSRADRQARRSLGRLRPR